jgi:hypothetical protein
MLSQERMLSADGVAAFAEGLMQKKRKLGG